MDYAIVRFNESFAQHLPHPQSTIDVIGRLVLRYDGDRWTTSEEFLELPCTKMYPEDSYDPAEYVDCPDRAAFLAMEGGRCVGYVRTCRRWNGNAHIEDITLDRGHRGRGLGTKLIDAVIGWANENGLHGVSLETQDWNLLACRFYMKYGFVLGGMDVLVYDAFEQTRSEAALYFYLLPVAKTFRQEDNGDDDDEAN